MKAMYKEELIEKIIKSSNLVSRKEKEELLEYWNNKKLYIEKSVFYLGSDKKTYSNMIFELNDEIANLQRENKQLNDNWNKLKEKTNEGIRICRNKGYDLVFGIEEIPKEELDDFLSYLAFQVMEQLIINIEQGSDK